MYVPQACPVITTLYSILYRYYAPIDTLSSYSFSPLAPIFSPHVIQAFLIWLQIASQFFSSDLQVTLPFMCEKSTNDILTNLLIYESTWFFLTDLEKKSNATRIWWLHEMRDTLKWHIKPWDHLGSFQGSNSWATRCGCYGIKYSIGKEPSSLKML